MLDINDITADYFIIDDELDYPSKIAVRDLITGDGVPMSYSCGYVLTEKGVVGIYMQNDLTILEIIFSNKLYDKTYDKEFTRAELQDIVVEFLKEIV